MLTNEDVDNALAFAAAIEKRVREATLEEAAKYVEEWHFEIDNPLAKEIRELKTGEMR